MFIVHGPRRSSTARRGADLGCKEGLFTIEGIRSWIMTITHEKLPLRQARRLRLSLSVVATDLATEHGGTDANKRDAVRQGGRLNLADVQL
jgi:hypothetical protein